MRTKPQTIKDMRAQMLDACIEIDPSRFAVRIEESLRPLLLKATEDKVKQDAARQLLLQFKAARLLQSSESSDLEAAFEACRPILSSVLGTNPTWGSLKTIPSEEELEKIRQEYVYLCTPVSFSLPEQRTYLGTLLGERNTSTLAAEFGVSAESMTRYWR